MTVRILQGDCRAVLATLPSASVHCCVTSPPYFNLRAYLPDGHPDKPLEIGLEQTPEAYVAALVAVFREVRRVLRSNGVMFLNLADSYAAGGNGVRSRKQLRNVGSWMPSKKAPQGIKPKDLLGIPWRVAFALQADGWFLRQDIIWSKPNPMPESVRDRCTKAHEYVFLLSKSARYYYDSEAISEPVAETSIARVSQNNGNPVWNGNRDKGSPQGRQTMNVAQFVRADGTRTRRSVWTIATEPSSLGHFALMPSALAALCIKAGTSERGCCPTCAAPWVRTLTESSGGKRTWHDHSDDLGSGQSQCKHGQAAWDTYTPRQTLGFSPSCACPAHTPQSCTILDPFGGAGTTGLVADRLGRDAILIELGPAYAAMAGRRIEDDAGMFASVVQAAE